MVFDFRVWRKGFFALWNRGILLYWWIMRSCFHVRSAIHGKKSNVPHVGLGIYCREVEAVKGKECDKIAGHVSQLAKLASDRSSKWGAESLILISSSESLFPSSPEAEPESNLDVVCNELTSVSLR